MNAKMTDGILSTIESWTGHKPRTCPWQAFYDPFAVRVIRAHRYYEKGQLDLWAPDASSRLIDGVAEYDRARDIVTSKRLRLDREEAERKRAAGVQRG